MPRKNKHTKKQIYLQIRNIFLILLGCFILAFGDAVFIVPTKVLAGGIASIAIIIQHVIDGTGATFPVADIVTAGLEIALFFLGLALLGKKFSAHTLLASLAYPGFFALLYRTNATAPITEALTTAFPEPFVGLLLCAIFGGICLGAGIGITMVGDGSTGGLDIIAIIFGKYLHIRESVTTFLVDAAIIIIGIVVLRDVPNILPLGLIGVICALVCSLMVQVSYVSTKAHCIVEVITTEEEKISRYVQDVLERGCTIIYGEGGYQHAPKRILKVACSHRQLEDLKAFIVDVDPKAFMMVTTSAQINGEGFLPFLTPRASVLKRFVSEAPKNPREKEPEEEDKGE